MAPYLTFVVKNAPEREHRLREVTSELRSPGQAGAQWYLMPADLLPGAVVFPAIPNDRRSTGFSEACIAVRQPVCLRKQALPPGWTWWCWLEDSSSVSILFSRQSISAARKRRNGSGGRRLRRNGMELFKVSGAWLNTWHRPSNSLHFVARRAREEKQGGLTNALAGLQPATGGKTMHPGARNAHRARARRGEHQRSLRRDRQTRARTGQWSEPASEQGFQ